MTLTPYNEEPKKDEPVYNPLLVDFEVKYDINGTNEPETFVIHGGEIEYFNAPVAEHIKKHLANKIIQERGVKTNHEDEYKAILQELTPDL